MSVVNEFGESCSLVSLWSDRKVIVFFARHMGCRFCKEQVSYLGGLKEWILQLNLDVSIIVITIGNYSDIQRFKKATNFDGEVYVDVDLQQPKSYSALKLNNGTEYLFVDQPRGEFLATTVLAADRASKNGFSDGGFSSSDVLYNGDTLQVRDSFISIKHRNKYTFPIFSSGVCSFWALVIMLTLVSGLVMLENWWTWKHCVKS